MKILFFGYFLMTGFLALFFSSCETKKGEAPPPVVVTAFQVEPQTVPADFQFVGVAKSSHPVEIRARVEGYLMSINYVEGSMVDKNQLLFRLDPAQFEASVEQAKGELARQEANLWRARKSLDRIEPLYKQNAASERDFDNAAAQVMEAEASVISAQANLEQAELNLSYTYIQSPIKGLSSRALYREGTLITPSINGLLTEISVINPIWVYFTISEGDLLQGRAETSKEKLLLPEENEYTVKLTLGDGSQYPFPGQVNFASPTLDPQTGAMTVRATFANPEGIVLPGQFVRATVSGARRPNALFVPQTAVFQGKKGMYVFVIDKDNKVSMRNVQVGSWYKNYWIIRQGLQPGEIVVAEGVNKVQQGSQVKVQTLLSPIERP